MNMATSYCEVNLSWVHEKPPSTITRYTFIDFSPSENNCFQSQSEDEKPSFSFLQGDTLLLSSPENERTENCVMNISCKNPNFTLINGLSVISESKTLEISNDIYGYITTVKGKPISKDHENEAPSLYSCKCCFDEDFTDLSVKFLSLGDRNSFHLQSLTINISQQSGAQKGKFDFAKLRKDIDSMGDSVSSRAREFLTTMEQFEQNKQQSFGAVSEMSSSSDYASIMALMCAPKTSGQFDLASNAQASSTQQSSSYGISDLINSLLGSGAVQSLLGKQSLNGDGSEQSDEAYELLKRMCGQVTDMRKMSAQNVESSDNKSTLEADKCATEEQNDDGHLSDLERTALMNEVDSKIEDAKKELQNNLSNVKEELTAKIDEARKGIEDKFDLILKMLQHPGGPSGDDS